MSSFAAPLRPPRSCTPWQGQRTRPSCFCLLSLVGRILCLWVRCGLAEGVGVERSWSGGRPATSESGKPSSRTLLDRIWHIGHGRQTVTTLESR